MFSKTMRAIRKWRELAEDVDWELYKWIEGRPSLSIYELAKSIGWSHGKVYTSVKRLGRDGLVKVEKEIRNGRSVSIVAYKKWQDFLQQRSWKRCAALSLWTKLNASHARHDRKPTMSVP